MPDRFSDDGGQVIVNRVLTNQVSIGNSRLSNARPLWRFCRFEQSRHTITLISYSLPGPNILNQLGRSEFLSH